MLKIGKDDKIQPLLGINSTYCESSLTKIPYADNKFDGILDFAGVNNFPNYENVINEYHRILRPNGYLSLLAWVTGAFFNINTFAINGAPYIINIENLTNLLSEKFLILHAYSVFKTSEHYYDCKATLYKFLARKNEDA